MGKFCIVDNDSRQLVAVRDEATATWFDPHGGTFSANECDDFDSVMHGESNCIVMHARTKYETQLDVFFAVSR